MANTPWLGPSPVHTSCIVSELKRILTFLIEEKRRIFLTILKLYEIQASMSINKVVLGHSH
jgi:hypothetical protein